MMQISIGSPNLSQFSVIMSQKDSTSTSNSIEFQPAWVSGVSTLLKGDKLCKNCEYHILVYSPSENSRVFLSIQSGKDFFPFKNDNLVFGNMDPNDKVCYKKQIRSTDTKIILSAMLFTGQVTVYANPNSIPANLKNFKKTWKLNSEFVETFYKREFENNKDNFDLYLCVATTNRSSSYTLNVYDITQAQNQQFNNILFNGIKLSGYLPAKSVTKYSLLDMEAHMKVTIDYEVVQGEIEVSGYYCKDSFCVVNDSIIKSWNTEKTLIKSNPTIKRTSIHQKTKITANSTLLKAKD